MALSVLDGNQTATTLSSVVTGGEHIVAHSVVSLGANAIANITSAVSGSVVSVSNFPASQSTTFGAVTGSVSVLNFPATQTIAGTVTANAGAGFSDAVYSGLLNYQDNEGGFPIESLPPISGTVTANADLTSSLEALNNYANYYDAAWPIKYFNTHGGDPLPISGTVTANVEPQRYDSYMGEPILPMGWATADGDAVLSFNLVTQQNPLPISGTVTVGNSVTISSLPAINGTVTVGNSVTIGAMPSGALTTRFGSVTTANTAQITSAVTNTSRKYLLAQNISAGTVTIGIGFSPTTTQGIQLTAGGGLTFDAFCPTGAVYWLGAVTGANYCLIEG